MNELKFPEETTYVLCTNDKGVYQFITVEPDQVCTSGQPIMETFTTIEAIEARIDELNLTGDNKINADAFLAQLDL
jgi:hypothetical protein